MFVEEQIAVAAELKTFRIDGGVNKMIDRRPPNARRGESQSIPRDTRFLQRRPLSKPP